MSLFDRVKSKIKEDLIIEMNNTGTDDPWDDDKDDKNKNKNNKNNKKTPPNKNKRFKRSDAAKKAADTAAKEAKGASSQIDPSEKIFKNRGRTLSPTDQKEISKRLSASTTRGDQARSQFGMGDGSVTGTPEGKPYTRPSKKRVKEIMDKSTVNKRAKRFRKSFGTPTGADYQTGEPTYKPSYTVDAKGKKNLGPDLGTGPDKKLPTTTGNTVPTDKTYEKISKNLGDREAGKSRYIDPKTNKASPGGVKKYISKARQMRTGSNIPVDKKTTDVIATSAGGEYRDKIQRKYGGRRITLKGTQQSQQTQQPQSNARRNMNRTLNFKDLKQKFKKLGSNISSKFSNFNKRLKDPTRGFAPYKKGIRAGLGNIKRYKHGGKLALAGLIAAPHIANLASTGINAVRGREKVSSKNTKDTGPLYSTKTGENIKFGYPPSGKPQGTVGSLFDKKVKSKVQSKLGTGEYDFRKK